MIEMKVEFAGVKDALKLINGIDKSVRQSYTREYKKIMAPAVKAAKARVPDEEPLSGMARAWTTPSGFQAFPWNGTVGEKLIKAGVSGRRPKEFKGITRGLAAFYVRWAGTTAVIFDMAGRRNNNDMSNNLAGKGWGEASRIMWPSILDNQDQIEAELKVLLDKIQADYERALTTGKVR